MKVGNKLAKGESFHAPSKTNLEFLMPGEDGSQELGISKKSHSFRKSITSLQHMAEVKKSKISFIQFL